MLPEEDHPVLEAGYILIIEEGGFSKETHHNPNRTSESKHSHSSGTRYNTS